MNQPESRRKSGATAAQKINKTLNFSILTTSSQRDEKHKQLNNTPGCRAEEGDKEWMSLTVFRRSAKFSSEQSCSCCNTHDPHANKGVAGFPLHVQRHARSEVGKTERTKTKLASLSPQELLPLDPQSTPLFKKIINKKKSADKKSRIPDEVLRAWSGSYGRSPSLG